MATTYTDVDRLILERWEDVIGLREAFDDLQKRIQDVLEEVGTRLERWAEEAGYGLEAWARDGCYRAWKPSWEYRKRGALIILEVGGLAPIGYRKSEWEHPYLCVLTENLESLRMKEADRVAFARELRQLLGERANEWVHPDISDADEPLGRSEATATERHRVEMISNPDKLFEFVKRSFQELFTLSDAISQALAKYRTP